MAGIVYASDRAELVKVTKLTMTAGSRWTAVASKRWFKKNKKRIDGSRET